MPRVARIVITQMPHHITQRGNNRQDVFFVDDDRQVYLEILRKQTGKETRPPLTLTASRKTKKET